MLPLPELSSHRTVSFVVGFVALFLIGAVWAFRALVHAFRRWAFGKGKVDIVKAWSAVEDLMARGDDMSARLAVMHADAVVDKALQTKHFPGDRFATRMQWAQRKYRKLRRVWWAHNLRNELSHNPDATLRPAQARKAIGLFKDALKELGAL